MTQDEQEKLDKLFGIDHPPIGTWMIEIPVIPKEANYNGPPHATLLRMGEGNIWQGLGYLMLSANPGCAEVLKELVKEANAYQQAQTR